MREGLLFVVPHWLSLSFVMVVIVCFNSLSVNKLQLSDGEIIFGGSCLFTKQVSSLQPLTME